MNPEDIRYHREHVWVRLSGEKGTIGVTDYAQEALGDIVYIDLPKVGTLVEANSAMAEIESTKSMSPWMPPNMGNTSKMKRSKSYFILGGEFVSCGQRIIALFARLTGGAIRPYRAATYFFF